MWTLIILGLIAWFTFRHFAKKKREADRRKWSVDFRETDIRPATRRLPWKELK
jgi:hypothetical protein